MKFVIIETPFVGDLHQMIIYTRWALRDAINRGDWAIPALGGEAGYTSQAERAVFYLDRGWTQPMLDALGTYLRAGVPVERRWLEDKQEIGEGLPPEAAAEIAKSLARQRIQTEDKLKAIAEEAGVELRWVVTAPA